MLELNAVATTRCAEEADETTGLPTGRTPTPGPSDKVSLAQAQPRTEARRLQSQKGTEMHSRMSRDRLCAPQPQNHVTAVFQKKSLARCAAQRCVVEVETAAVMGIHGLLPLLKSAEDHVCASEFSGQVAVIDAMSW